MERVTIPDLPLTGGCQCGALRYTIHAAPTTFYACHCTDCRRQSGSAFGLSLQVEAVAMTVSGATAVFSRRGASGREMACHFCPACGARLWHAVAAGSSYRSLKAGTLDDPSWLRPAAHIWVASRLPWVAIPADAVTWEGQPDMGRLRALWTDMVG